MNREQFKRFHELSEKAMKSTASTLDINEFNEFLKSLNHAMECKCKSQSEQSPIDKKRH